MPLISGRFRDFQIAGESLIRVMLGGHLRSGSLQTSGIFPVDDASLIALSESIAGTNVYSGILPNGVPTYQTYELGLAQDEIRILPTTYHKDLPVDGFGPEVPLDVMTMGGICNIKASLFHYDAQILDVMYSESMGGVYTSIPGSFNSPMVAGSMAANGTLLRGDRQVGASGNHFFSLSILSPQGGRPYFFPACYLTEQPIEIPLGTHASVALCNFRAIPVPFFALSNASGGGMLSSSGSLLEMTSSGAVLYNYNPST